MVPKVHCLVLRGPSPVLTLSQSKPIRPAPSGKFVDNSTKLTCLQITRYRIKYSTVLWLPELNMIEMFGRRYSTFCQ